MRALAAAAALVVATPAAGTPLAGLNLAGAEFGAARGGVYGRDWIYPGAAEIDDLARRGFSVLRLPFVWERVQPVTNGPLDADEVARIESVVALARKRRVAVILDLHNYARRDGAVVGSEALPSLALADVWRRLGERFRGRDGVIFGLMNEPHDMPIAQWAAAAQAALDAVRAAGACNLVLVPGAAWTGAHSWTTAFDGVSNAQAMTAVHDPAGRVAYEFHQYLDADWSGRAPTCRPPAEAVAAVSVATDWLAKQGAKGFLGEVGAGRDPACLEGLEGMLAHLDAHPAQWLGFAGWAAGAWWPDDYPLLLRAKDGVDPPQLAVLQRHAGPGDADLSRARCRAHPRPNAVTPRRPP